MRSTQAKRACDFNSVTVWIRGATRHHLLIRLYIEHEDLNLVVIVWVAFSFEQ